MEFELIILIIAAFFAGFIDSVVGGGGLIQIPALLIMLPHIPIAVLFGTNKLASICGTVAAAIQYIKNVRIKKSITAPATLAALIFSYLGARTVSYLDPALLRPMILILLAAVAIYTFKKKNFGSSAEKPSDPVREFLCSAAIGITLGFYDGFFGPGTGSFLIMCFIWVFGLDFLQASGSAKIVNIATNLSALLYFGANEGVLYSIGIPMGIANIVGAIAGAKMAILKGNSFVRRCFLALVTALILKLGWDML